MKGWGLGGFSVDSWSIPGRPGSHRHMAGGQSGVMGPRMAVCRLPDPRQFFTVPPRPYLTPNRSPSHPTNLHCSSRASPCQYQSPTRPLPDLHCSFRIVLSMSFIVLYMFLYFHGWGFPIFVCLLGLFVVVSKGVKS